MGTLVHNKKAHFEYEILEELEAGVSLLGSEVKALRGKLGSLAGARVLVRGGEALLVGATIPPYQPSNIAKDYDPERVRRLLVSKKEMRTLADAEDAKGLTTIPLSLYTKGRNIKLSVGIVRGKKKADKREKIRARDTQRELQRELRRK